MSVPLGTLKGTVRSYWTALQEQTQSIDGLLRLSLKDYVGGNLLYLAHEQVKSARVLFSRGIGSQSAGGQKLELKLAITQASFFSANTLSAVERFYTSFGNSCYYCVIVFATAKYEDASACSSVCCGCRSLDC